MQSHTTKNKQTEILDLSQPKVYNTCSLTCKIGPGFYHGGERGERKRPVSLIRVLSLSVAASEESIPSSATIKLPVEPEDGWDHCLLFLPPPPPVPNSSPI